MEPVTLGANFWNSLALNPTVIIKPEDNVAGVVIRTCSASGPNNGMLITGTTKPKDAFDFYTKPAVLVLGSGGSTVQLPYPVFLPPGFGLWAMSANTNVRVSLTYDLLS
ncbi:hypothetical protein [Pseudomonas fluorescens]|uniref:hypothetical protein n=1 Tax=Pseudomonas fluorescens TaxID=294 RepID=UPI00058A7874|nr:hypothetical protein [Pseudomonas fluorescens]CEL28764.1 hypothetical protein SRM1_02112 [Pseudomonas fluorescens]